MPGPLPRPNSMLPAAKACCTLASPVKSITSTSRPYFAKIPSATPRSAARNVQAAPCALPRRTLSAAMALPAMRAKATHNSAPALADRRAITSRSAERLEILRRPADRAPHMRDRRIVVAQAFLGLPEIAPDDVDKRLPTHLRIGIEGVDVVDRDEARGHVPFVLARAAVSFLDVIVGHVIFAEIIRIEHGIFVADGFIREEAQRLMRANRPAHFLVDIGLDQLRAP